jgi:hypothetical protein
MSFYIHIMHYTLKLPDGATFELVISTKWQPLTWIQFPQITMFWMNLKR